MAKHLFGGKKAAPFKKGGGRVATKKKAAMKKGNPFAKKGKK